MNNLLLHASLEALINHGLPFVTLCLETLLSEVKSTAQRHIIDRKLDIMQPARVSLLRLYFVPCSLFYRKELNAGDHRKIRGAMRTLRLAVERSPEGGPRQPTPPKGTNLTRLFSSVGVFAYAMLPDAPGG